VAFGLIQELLAEGESTRIFMIVMIYADYVANMLPTLD
jgi:hypothetical protein